ISPSPHAPRGGSRLSLRSAGRTMKRLQIALKFSTPERRCGEGVRTMDDITRTDKMLSRKEGKVGYVIFNNPERHNAVSLEMWEATARILEDFGKDDEARVIV